MTRRELHGTTRELHGTTDTSAPSAQEIVARYQRLSVAEHPLFADLAKRPVDMSALWLLMANLREGISRDFVIWLAVTISRVDDRRIGSLLAKQLDDELGSGDFTRIHSLLLDQFVSALSAWRIEAPHDLLLRPGQKLLEEARVPFYADQPYEAVGALIVGEIFANKMDTCLGNQLRRQQSLSEEQLIWLTIHETLEANHAADSGELALLVPRQGQELAATWRGAEMQWESLWRFLDRVQNVRSALASGSQTLS
jgi:pyrroloquinoline quinone (PQQ) biosynthesis protein C